MKFIKSFAACFICVFLLFADEAFSVSTAEKAKVNYQSTLLLISSLRIAVENFSEEGGQETFQKIRDLFFSAREDFYGRNYVAAYEKYTSMKTELMPFMEELCQSYLTRTKEILDATAKETANVVFDFRRDVPFRRYFFDPYDPVARKRFYIPPYTAENYHLFRDGRVLETYIQKGYESYFDAKRLFEDSEIEYIKSLEKKTPKDLDYVLDKYDLVIKLCRQSKQYGIEIYKLYNINSLGEIGAKYDVSTINLNPLYDERIPEQYRVDAVDNQRLVYESEKIRLEPLENDSSSK